MACCVPILKARPRNIDPCRARPSLQRRKVIQHGRNDPRVPVSESEHIHAVLTQKGIPSELLIFEDEGHTVEKLPNRIETFTRIAEFLDRVLAV